MIQVLEKSYTCRAMFGNKRFYRVWCVPQYEGWLFQAEQDEPLSAIWLATQADSISY